MAGATIAEFFDQMIDATEQEFLKAKIQRLWLGGHSGPDGGEGVRPGGFIGQLIQTLVAYDETEAATILGSGSLLDNLNHIRYNLATLSGMTSSGIISYFTQLLDVPSSYVGHAGETIVVNSTETGLEFGTVIGEGGGSSHVHALARWNVASGTYTLPLPDFASEILELNGNGLMVDPLTYTLTTYDTITLDNPVVTSTVFVSEYLALLD